MPWSRPAESQGGAYLREPSANKNGTFVARERRTSHGEVCVGRPAVAPRWPEAEGRRETARPHGSMIWSTSSGGAGSSPRSPAPRGRPEPGLKARELLGGRRSDDLRRRK